MKNAATLVCVVLVCLGTAPVMLPDGWLLQPPQSVVSTGTMPQGMSVSPDGSVLAVVESGYNPAALSLYRIPSLSRARSIRLPGAFGRPVWVDSGHVLVAGANSDALLLVDVRNASLRRIPFPKGSTPVYVSASSAGVYAVACAGDRQLRIGRLGVIGNATGIPIGGAPGGLAFSPDGSTLYAAGLSNDTLLAVDVRSLRIKAQRVVGLHPAGVFVSGGSVYVAEIDADRVGVYTPDLHAIKDISVADAAPGKMLGVSPSAISGSGGTIFVTLGAANSIAVIRNGEPIGRMQAGWYPTDVAVSGGYLYVLNGKGEGAHPNPQFRYPQGDAGYVAALEAGSLRRYAIPGTFAMNGNPQGASSWNASDPSSVVRPHGPIRHVFFVLKENRSYDQILGDDPAGNGDPQLAWFGRKVTPNEHALAARFGLYDNAYVNGEVSAVGHMWSDSAFANDYAQRVWPALYANRLDLLTHDDRADVTASGYLWVQAHRDGVSFRDYGELVDPGKTPQSPWVADVPSLRGLFDDRYAGWNLNYSDLDRVKEWQREFQAFVRTGTLPQFEFIWLPNDHTYGSAPGKLTPSAYVAQNDAAFGRIVQTLSHSSVWSSSVLFAIEDDAQDGPDHVSDQRTTLFVVSPYARTGVHHEHYATVSVLRTIEMMLGMKPLSTYDAMAAPMYSAFSSTPDMRPYTAIAPQIDITRRNQKTAYGAEQSARLNFSRPDAIAPAALNRILARNHSR
ncbi:MAG TPA: alkaline phosphatase family protein [Candidatus Baltobacteraceae bacterium]|nr:alkaline phosphatase family protein [Candidatus Baltobacteraceae bacterium]